MNNIKHTYIGSKNCHYHNSHCKDLENNDTMRIIELTGYPFKLFYERENNKKIKKVYTGINMFQYRVGLVFDIDN